MIDLEEAQAFVWDRCRPLRTELTDVAAALGRVLAEPVVSRVDVPAFANTAMDGFALRAADVVDAPCQLEIVGTIAAGDRGDLVVGQGQAARIMTGAPLPTGADAVIMVELTSVDSGTNRVLATEAVPAGNHVRYPGEDISVGQPIFGPGTELGPGHLGVLCTLGETQIKTFAVPKVGVLSTGDELVDDGAPLERGQIRDSNRRTLLSLVAEAGAEPVNLGLVRDDPDEIRRSLVDAVSRCDALITSGGVSMGDFDYVKMVLQEIGDMRWMQVAIKPAKPLAFGTVEGIPIFGLPGNPVSSMVSFELFARPALRKMMGHQHWERPKRSATTSERLRSYGDDKVHFARVIARFLNGKYVLESAGGQGSHQLFAMASANALAIMPDEEPADLPYRVDFIPLD